MRRLRWCFTLCIIGGAPLMRSVGCEIARKKWVALIVSGIWAFYILTYSMNSASGGYWARPEMDGHDKVLFRPPQPSQQAKA